MSTKRRRRRSPEQIMLKLRDADAMLKSGKDLAAARQLTTAWKEDYSHHQPHSSLGYLTPVEFAARCAQSVFATLSPHEHRGTP